MHGHCAHICQKLLLLYFFLLFYIFSKKTFYDVFYASFQQSETEAHSAKSMNVSDVNVTDEDDFLPRSKTIKANNRTMKKPLGYTSEDAIDEGIASNEYCVCEPIQAVQDYTCKCPRSQNLSRRRRKSPPCMTKWFVGVTHGIRRKHSRRACQLQFERNPIHTSRSTKEMSRMECGHPGNFLTVSYRLKVNEFAALTTSESMSRYTRLKPNNVWSDLKQLRAHEHGELSDPWSEL